MTLRRTQAALGRLQDFTLPPQLVEHGGRGFIGRRHDLTELLTDFVGLAADFARALEADRADGELKRREGTLGRLVGPGGPFEEARRAAHERVRSAVGPVKSSGRNRPGLMPIPFNN